LQDGQDPAALGARQELGGAIGRVEDNIDVSLRKGMLDPVNNSKSVPGAAERIFFDEGGFENDEVRGILEQGVNSFGAAGNGGYLKAFCGQSRYQCSGGSLIAIYDQDLQLAPFEGIRFPSARLASAVELMG